jgi:ADP-ribosylglycohydrolase
MRAAVLGAAIDEQSPLLAFVRASTRLTHTDPKAEYGAVAVALAARHARQNKSVDANQWLSEVAEVCGAAASEFLELLRQAVRSVEAGESTKLFAQALGLQRGVTGYTYHTVPVAIHAWLAQPSDFRAAVMAIIRCGGDADTTAAIVGGIVGASVGKDGIPDDWLKPISEYPRSLAWMQLLGETLASTLDGEPPRSTPSVNPIAVLVRNLLFLLVVLFHGFRRLTPPY